MQHVNERLKILAKMISNLDLKELKSLRATDKHLRDMMEKPIF
jgi:hypothetical protein